MLSQIRPVHLLTSWMTSHEPYGDVSYLSFVPLFALESLTTTDFHWAEFFVTRASIGIGMSSTWVTFQFWVDYPFKYIEYIIIWTCVEHQTKPWLWLKLYFRNCFFFLSLSVSSVLKEVSTHAEDTAGSVKILLEITFLCAVRLWRSGHAQVRPKKKSRKSIIISECSSLQLP